MRKVILPAIIVFFLIYLVKAQETGIDIMMDGKEIIVDVLPESGLVYSHSLERGETLYSLARYFQTEVNDIFKINKLNPGASLDPGRRVIIPFDPRIMFKGENLASNRYGVYIPVYYIVKAKDNLFRLSKYVFDQPLETMMARNQMNDYNLTIGQRLLAGWIPIDSDKEIKHDKSLEVKKDEIPLADTIGLYIKNELFNPEVAQQKADRFLTKSKGIAIWDRNSSDHENMFALHASAKSNSIIEIYNPLLNRTAYATVIGSIPNESYPEDVSLIISPKVAKVLGALDTRFLVEVKYYQ